ncbi:MAG: SCO family protein [Betaproteobacteria bacterium]|nr:SCO family protein [Betaproteobacteria bacterium]
MKPNWKKASGVLLFCGILFGAYAARAVTPPQDAKATTIDPKLMQIDEANHLGASLPRDLVMMDADGREFPFGELLGKPSILLLSYYGCDGTCPTMNKLLYLELPKVTRFRLGADYRVLTVSFDRNDTAETAAGFLRKSGIPPDLHAGWRHAIMKDREAAIDALTKAVGFRYFWSRLDKMFLHPNVLVFVTPDGRVARYLYGTTLDARAIELALIDADWNRIANSGNVIDMLTGVCFSYNYAEGRYQPNYSLLIGVGSFVFGIALMVLGALAYRVWRRRKSAAA